MNEVNRGLRSRAVRRLKMGLQPLKSLGGLHASRARSKIVLILVGLLLTAAANPAIMGHITRSVPIPVTPCRWLSMPLWHLRSHRGAQSSGAPQPDRLRRLVQFRPRGNHGDIGL